MYQITDYSYKQAKLLGVEIKPSSNKSKKIDVFKNGSKIASIGAYGMKDFPTYLKEKGKAYADNRKKLYYIRNSKNKGLNGFYAKKILW
tara:strand:+ start:2985 stop:3251 length:267 start_codon:yes stop_codon:yes gene_type:complete